VNKDAFLVRHASYVGDSLASPPCLVCESLRGSNSNMLLDRGRVAGLPWIYRPVRSLFSGALGTIVTCC
jgi:hypothetical protein